MDDTKVALMSASDVLQSESPFKITFFTTYSCYQRIIGLLIFKFPSQILFILLCISLPKIPQLVAFSRYLQLLFLVLKILQNRSQNGYFLRPHLSHLLAQESTIYFYLFPYFYPIGPEQATSLFYVTHNQHQQENLLFVKKLSKGKFKDDSRLKIVIFLNFLIVKCNKC